MGQMWVVEGVGALLLRLLIPLGSICLLRLVLELGQSWYWASWLVV
jgi:hypothetical protein